MAKLSLGKAFGDTNRKTSRRMLKNYGVDSTIVTQNITAPGLKPSNSIVDTYQQVERMNVPSVQLGKFANAALGFDNSADLRNLANSLSSFNQNLQATASTLAKRQKQIDTQAKNVAKSIELQNFGNNLSPIEKLEKARTELSSVINNTESTKEQRDAAEKQLDFIDARNNILLPHLESQNRIINIQTNAATLSSKAAGATVLNSLGEEIPLNSLRPDDPLYLKWRQETVYGDSDGNIIPLTSKESQEVSATVVSAYAGDINRQEKAVIQHNKDVYEKDTLVQVDGIAGMHLTKKEPDEVIKLLNGIIDDSRFMQLYRTKEERDKFINDIVKQWSQRLLINGLNTDNFLEAEEAFAPWEQLMTGPKKDRILENGEVNENLKWFKGQDPGWLINTRTAYTKALNEYKTLNKTTQVQKGNQAITNAFTKDILPLYKKIDELAGSTEGGFADAKVGVELRKANEKYQELKESIIANVPIEHQAKVLEFANKLQKTNDALFFGAERTQLKNDLRREFRQVFQNPRLAIKFRNKVTEATNSGAVSEEFGMNLINRTNNLVEGLASNVQKTANELIKKELARWTDPKNGFFFSSKSGSSNFTLEEVGMAKKAENMMIDMSNDIIQKGLENNKSDDEIGAELIKLFEDNNFGLVLPEDVDTKVGVMFENIEDFKKQYLGANFYGGINSKEQKRLSDMYNSDQPMFKLEALEKILDDWNKNNRGSTEIKGLIQSLTKTNSGLNPRIFFENQFLKHGITDSLPIRDEESFNKKFSMLNNIPPQPSFIEKIAAVPVNLIFGGAANAGELRSTDPYNYQPPAGTQTVADILKISLTSDFTPDEAVIMAAIGMAESSGRPHAHNTEGDDNSYGIFQINMLDRPGFMMGEERRGQFGLDSNEQLFDPLINGKAAKYIYDMQGFEAWTVYRTGAYLKYLPAAPEALKSLSE